MAVDENDFYGLLGVPRDCSDDDLKRAYRKLARELHPDANPDDPHAEERFKQVTLAYEVLRDPERRRRYDMFGPDAIRGAGGGGSADADPFGFGGAGLGDIFEAFFGGSTFGGGGRGPRRGPVRGGDLEILIHLDFEGAGSGVQREVSVKAPTPCETCGGVGTAPGTSPSRCSVC